MTLATNIFISYVLYQQHSDLDNKMSSSSGRLERINQTKREHIKKKNKIKFDKKKNLCSIFFPLNICYFMFEAKNCISQIRV